MNKLRRFFKGKWKHIVAIGIVVSLLYVLVPINITINPPTEGINRDSLTIGENYVTFTIGTDVYAAGVADYTCDGTDDDVQFQAALDALPAGGGQLVVLTGAYSFSATVSRAIDNVTIQGVGQASSLSYDGGTPIFSAGVRSDWTFSDLKFDAGGITYLTSTNYTLRNVAIGATYYAYRTDATADEWEIPVGRTATFTVAASDSSASSKAQADYVGDGTDDQAEIQTAIDALPANGGAVVLLTGTYNISSPIVVKDFTSLIGETLYAGHTTGGAYLKATAGLITGLIINKTYNDEGPAPIGHNTTISLIGLDIDMTLAAGIDAIHYEGVDYSTVQYSNIVANGYGVYLTAGIDEFWLVGTSIWYPNPTGFFVVGQYIHVYDSNFISGDNGIEWFAKAGVIEGSSFEGQGVAGIYSGAGALISRDLSISNNYFTKEVQRGISLLRIRGVTITGNTFSSNETAGWGTGQDAINLNLSEDIAIVGNTILDASRSVADDYDAIRLDSSSDCTIIGNIISSPGAFTRFGIYLNNSDRNVVLGNIVKDMVTTGIVVTASSDSNIVTGNNISNSTYALDIGTGGAGVGNISFNAHDDFFMDVLAVSATQVRSNEDLSEAIPNTFTLDAQPDVPRTLSGHFDTHAQITAYTIVFTGVDAKGNIVTETFTEAASPWDFETVNSYSTITSIIMTARTGTGAGDTMDIGITDVLGLSNNIYATADVYKIKKNNANAVVAVAQVNATYDTYDMAVIGLGGTDDFTIWYRSNLNILN